jgi:hypothetical protein
VKNTKWTSTSASFLATKAISQATISPSATRVTQSRGWNVSLVWGSMPRRRKRTAGVYAAACWPNAASDRGTSRGCRGGTSEPRVCARNVGQGALPGIAHSPARRK